MKCVHFCSLPFSRLSVYLCSCFICICRLRGISLSVLLVFINVQNKQISIDTLTGINNRRQLALYIASELSALSKKGELYYLIMDVDKFKSINDTYGHLEGDNALIKIASLLNSLCEIKNDYSCRRYYHQYLV